MIRIRKSGPHSDQCVSRMGETFASTTTMDLSKSIDNHLKNPVHHLIQESYVLQLIQQCSKCGSGTPLKLHTHTQDIISVLSEGF